MVNRSKSPSTPHEGRQFASLTSGFVYKRSLRFGLSVRDGQRQTSSKTPITQVRTLPFKRLSLIMAAINGLLSLIGGASGLATLFDFMIPDPSAVAERGNCLVTVQVGLDGTGGDDGDLEGAGGHFPLVLLFNNNDDQIGQTADADMILTQIGSGAFETLEIGTGSGYVP